MTATQFVPTLLLAPTGGVIADRFEKRRLIIITQTVAGLLAGLLGVLTLTGRVELWMVYLISIGFGSVTAIVGTFTYEFTTTIPMFAEFTFGAGFPSTDSGHAHTGPSR